jgi:hypothetical protein
MGDQSRGGDGSSFSMLVVKEKRFIGEDFAIKPSDPGS